MLFPSLAVFDEWTGDLKEAKKHPISASLRERHWILEHFDNIEDYELWKFFQGFDTEHTLTDSLRDKLYSLQGE